MIFLCESIPLMSEYLPGVQGWTISADKMTSCNCELVVESLLSVLQLLGTPNSTVQPP